MDLEPLFEVVRDSADSSTWRTTVPLDHPCFDGHFESNPVLPGVAQLALVVDVCAAMGIGSHDRLHGFEHVKFLQPVLPDSACSVRVEPRLANHAAGFQIRCDGRVVTTGTLLFK